MRGYEYETNGYHRAMEDEYEGEYYDEDEYEEEGSGAGEEYVEEEQPPEGQQEFLEIRERLKEQIRRRAQGAGASTAGRSSSSHDRKSPTNFGSFFGPSKPVISKRVIEERKSMKELQDTMSQDRKPSGVDKMMLTDAPLLYTPGQLALAALHKSNDLHRVLNFEREYEGIFLDYSRQRATGETMEKLFKLAEAAKLKEKVEKMFRGDRINSTENRSVLDMLNDG